MHTMLFKLLNVITLVAVEALLRLSRGERYTFHSLFNAQLQLAGKRSYVMCVCGPGSIVRRLAPSRELMNMARLECSEQVMSYPD